MTETVLRIGFSLLIVFGLMWGVARVVRQPLRGRDAGGPMAVLGRQQLSRGSLVAVVRVADRAFVVGVTEQQVNLLAETDLAVFAEHGHGVRHRDPVPLDGTGSPTGAGPLDESVLAPRTWTSTVNFLRERTTRH